MKNKNLWSALIICLLYCSSCSNVPDSSNGTEGKQKEIIAKKGIKENLNISILLDLSDRIDPIKNASPAMEFYKRDLGYIESISKAFEAHLRKKPIRQINDQIQVYFDPEPSSTEINSLAKELRMSFNKETVSKEAIARISPQFASISEKIYMQAIHDKKYLGADIWGFFKTKVKDYCIKPNYRNILFILTDGYVFHENSKFMEENRSSYLTPQLVKALGLKTSAYKDVMQKQNCGFIKATDGLTELEVVVLGINPVKNSPFEGDVIDEYWKNWLQDMNVKEPITAPILADLPTNLDPVISRYILSGLR
ncbi:hypothetical protein LZQ00_11235 [Sphingobacterium sp. SRCM116780]|uniref:hypothetical protein n=1 Tax=Sphingobacterium sp. SRCM116780 TaxID=2907623 RepID=UPI001F24382F|nr:hypothetical protein [Sphingobacterium sp. SRCM116780]UIR54851.1 hypothetical protein LZQ00_11235 [Sphingobacterium sp. SRCM116780]